MSPDQKHSTGTMSPDVPPGATTDALLKEIQRRLVSVHYALAEGPAEGISGEPELRRWARRQLEEVLQSIHATLD